jgi:hypothetical protein
MTVMRLQNRVDPFGVIHFNPERGLFMGNRGGKIHDPATKLLLKRRFASRRWIVCVCKYRDRRRKVMGDGYTELFFLDDVTALSAGHRPCAFCRRPTFRAYCAAIANGAGVPVKIDDVDLKLHGQRLGPKPKLADSGPGGLADGVMVALGNTAYAKRQGMALPWSFAGYEPPVAWAEVLLQNPVLLTPLTSANALANGYQPVWHPSAGT